MFDDLLYPLPVQFAAAPNQALANGSCFAGGLAWVYTGLGWKMFRVRISDGAIIDFTGNATTYSDANASRVITNGYAECGPVTNGLEVVQLTAFTTSATLTRFALADASVIESVALAGINNCVAYKGIYDEIDSYWFPLYNHSKVLAVNAATMAYSTFATAAPPYSITWDGTHVWVSSVTGGSYNVYKYATDGTLVTTKAMDLPCYAIHFDGTYIWAGSNGAVVKIRASDGAFIDATGAVVATYDLARSFTHEVAAILSITHLGDTLFAANDNAGTGSSLNRFRLSDGTYGGMFPGYGRSPAQITVEGIRMIVSNKLGTGTAVNPHLALLNSDVTTPTPNLTAVDPGTGPHLSLTFDNPVGITGPTIGAAAAGLGVLSATQIDTTHIDLACAIRPDHPDGDATSATLVPPVGEADNLGPPVPTGIGATVI